MRENTVPPLFRVIVRHHVPAAPDEVYAVVSDLPRCGEWSAECTGGRWVDGAPAALGSVFRGENFRDPHVVGWAPVVRGSWSTEAEVVEATGRRFGWAMRDSAGRVQDSVWSFELAPSGGGSELTHAFRMGAATEGIRGITAGLDDAGRARFFADWSDKLAADMAMAVVRIECAMAKAV